MSGGSRGAGDRPLTYAGEYDPDRTYLPREVATSGGKVYMAVALTVGHAPPDAVRWLPLGRGRASAQDPFTADGVTQDFTLSNTPDPFSEDVYLNGLRMRRTTDYTISGDVVSLVGTPDASPRILSNKVAGYSTAVDQFAWLDVGSSDFTIDVDWTAVLASSPAGVLVHYVDGSHYYTCTRDGVYDSGTLVFAYTGGATFAAADHMQVTWVSSVLTVYKNGVDVRHITFTGGGSQLSSTLNGFYCKSDATTRWDNWAATGCTTPYSDNFNRADGPLGSPWTGPVTYPSGALDVAYDY